MLPVAILAGGLATRLRPITEKTPKSLVEVAGRPFIFHHLDWLQRQRIPRVVICVGHLGEMIQAKVGQGDRWGMEVLYSCDGARLLGTGGALQKALPMLGEEFFVFYGDSYLPIDFQPVEEAFRASGQPALMTILRNRGQWDRSNVEAREGRILLYDKKNPTPSMEYIDYGLGVLSAGLVRSHREGEPWDLADLYRDLARKEQLASWEVRRRFFEIGSMEGLAETETFLKAESA